MERGVLRCALARACAAAAARCSSSPRHAGDVGRLLVLAGAAGCARSRLAVRNHRFPLSPPIHSRSPFPDDRGMESTMPAPAPAILGLTDAELAHFHERGWVL